MKAAVVLSFESPPVYESFAVPVPSNGHEELVDVLAAGFHPRVRSQADGSHYTSTGRLPFVPGMDGVGRREDSSLVFFALDDALVGSMAEKTVIDTRRSVRLPDGTDPARIAAGMNPGMSSWIALTRRIEWESGQSVLVLGATGNAGRMAVQISKHLGAASVIAAGRNLERLKLLPSLGADVVVQLAGDSEVAFEELGKAAGEVDVVLDYVWGRPALESMIGIIKARSDRSRRLSWIQIGVQAGATIELPSAVLRQANLHLLGSGQGSVGMTGMIEELAALAAHISDGTIDVNSRTVRLSQVTETWEETPEADRRIVFMP